jgi:DNA polymerase-4
MACNVSILYCAVPHFAAALARRGDPGLEGRPLVLIGPEERVFDVSAEAAACGIVAGITPRAAEVCCPEARLIDADIARCREEFEALLQLLERSSSQVEPHGWGAAYVDLGDLTRRCTDAVACCQRVGRRVRQEFGQALQPALGWDSSKFTAQAAARRTQPGHILAVGTTKERAFLHPLPVTLLPLSVDALQRLGFLGLRTLGQYAALPLPAVGLQFGQAGRLAHRCARGEDDRPVVPRHQAPCRVVGCELEAPMADRGRLLAALGQVISPVLSELRGGLKACGQMRLTVDFDDGSTQERTRTFLIPTADEPMVMRILGQLLDGMRWHTCAVALAAALEQVQDTVMEQLTLFHALQQTTRLKARLNSAEVKNEREQKLQDVQRYLAARFGANRLRQVMLTQPGAPLPEWRVSWLEDDER